MPPPLQSFGQRRNSHRSPKRGSSQMQAPVSALHKPVPQPPGRQVSEHAQSHHTHARTSNTVGELSALMPLAIQLPTADVHADAPAQSGPPPVIPCHSTFGAVFARVPSRTGAQARRRVAGAVGCGAAEGTGVRVACGAAPRRIAQALTGVLVAVAFRRAATAGRIAERR